MIPTEPTTARAIALEPLAELPTWSFRVGTMVRYLPRAWMAPASSAGLYELFALNIVLQMFDGAASYAGISMGWQEGNPLLRGSFPVWGVGQTLLLFKALAAGILFLIYRRAPAHLATAALRLAAVTYCTCSLLPWYGILLSALLF